VNFPANSTETPRLQIIDWPLTNGSVPTGNER
jgi:hypothetical protein